MKSTSLVYIEKDNKYLMLHRTKKINDENHDKWIGVGGKLEEGESPFDCARREILEETGLSGLELSYKGIVTFVSDKYGTEYMHLFLAKGNTEGIQECNEGELVWVDKNEIYNLPIWEGDKIFFELIKENNPFFSLKLVYKDDMLISHSIEYAN